MPQLRAVRQQSIFDLSPTAFTREEVEMQNLRLFLRAAAYQCTVNKSPESLLQSLRNPRTLPFEAIKAAKSDRERLTPLLIQELQKFAADFQSYDQGDILPVIAIYLLAEWEVAESFETVLDCFALDDKYGGYELGDLITESGPVILAALCRADLDALEGRWKESSALHDSNAAHASSKSTASPVPAPSTGSKVGRNEPCPCGSGKKYKKCCGRLPQ